MNDHIKSEISSYLAGGLPESRSRQIEAHAAACEKCRNALSKARAKLPRIKREALKNASTENLPNLFWDRQRKMLWPESVSKSKLWIALGLLVVAGGGYWAYVKSNAVQRNVVTPNAVKPNDVQPNVVQRNAVQPDDVQQNAAPPPPPPATKPKPAEPENPPTVLPTLADWKGADCGITESRLVVIRNADAWQKLWTEMALKDPLPQVNFDKAIVIGVFAGERPAGSSVILGRIDAYDDEVMAPYRVLLPSVPDAVQGSSAAAASPAPVLAATGGQYGQPLHPQGVGAPVSHPYLLATIPRVDKKIRLTQKEKRS